MYGVDERMMHGGSHVAVYQSLWMGTRKVQVGNVRNIMNDVNNLTHLHIEGHGPQRLDFSEFEAFVTLDPHEL